MMQKMAKMDMKMGLMHLNIVERKRWTLQIKERVANGYVKDPAKEGMDMNHSKMEGWKKDDIKQKANGYVEICKGRNGNGSF
jgi:hypothetical protein